MTLQRTRLTGVTTLTTTTSTIYANPATAKSYIRTIMFHNFSVSDVLVTVHSVPDNAGSVGTASTGNQILNRVIKANETLEWALHYPITMVDTNDTIQADAASNSSVNILINGDVDL
jgi:hypothetical protein